MAGKGSTSIRMREKFRELSRQARVARDRRNVSRAETELAIAQVKVVVLRAKSTGRGIHRAASLLIRAIDLCKAEKFDDSREAAAQALKEIMNPSSKSN